MELIFLIYGLAFFLLGFSILYYPKKHSLFSFAREILFIGWFGIVHGINEWLDMLTLVNALGLSKMWTMLRLITLPVSFFALIYFGARVIAIQRKNCQLCRYFPLVLVGVWGLLFWAGRHTQQNWDILSRYVLCLPGAAMAGLALLTYVPETRQGSNVRLAANLKIAGIAFIVYAFLAGLVVKDAAFWPASVINYSLFTETIGLPVQLFRSLCAVIIAYNLVRVLTVFHLETQRLIFNSEMRFRTVVNTAPVSLFMVDGNQKVTFFEGKGLAEAAITSDAAVGKPVAEVFSAFPQIQQGSLRAIVKGDEFTELISGQKCHYELFFAPIKDPQGAVTGAIGVAMDVTEQKNARFRIEQYRAEMEQNRTLAALGALSTEIVGQISDPLCESRASLMKALGGLRKLIGARDVREDIQSSIDRLNAAVKTLDGFCTRANLEPSSAAQPIDLYETVHRVLSVFRETAQRRAVHITVEGAERYPVMKLSTRELEQVLYTLIQTIFQSADGVCTRNVELDFSVSNKMLVLKCVESSPEETDRAAEDVSAEDKPLSADRKDFDFGLSVLKGIVEAYTGTLTIERKPQGETEYRIHLPLAG